MANLIQIKRSLNTATPASLANGELAFTANGDVLYVGSNSTVVAIGGKRTPGTLTANQALVANATSYIDSIKVANATIDKIYANGAHGTDEQLLTSNSTGGLFWAAPAVIDLDDLSDVAVSSASAGQILISNSTGIFRNLSLSGDITVDDAGVVAIAADSVALGTDTTGNYVATITAGNGLSGNVASEGSTPTLAVVAGSGIASNSTGVFVVAGDGIASNATGVHVVAGTGVVSNATGVHIGQAVGTTDNVTFNNVTINGNTAVGSNFSDVVSINAGVNTSILPTANVTYSLGNNTLRWSEIHAGNTHTTNLIVDTNAVINGNLTVSGSLVTINVATLSVTDSLIQLASNNDVSDTLDIGFFGNYNDGVANVHAGLFRDATSDTFKLFKGLEPQPTTTVNVSGTGYTQASLEAYLSSGALVSNSTAVTLTANSTVAVNMTANSLTLTTALVGTSGGTGLASYTAEDILVANSSNGFRKLTLGTDGHVLQSNGTALIYSTLDGGTF
jgi:hypothetical protein